MVRQALGVLAVLVTFLVVSSGRGDGPARPPWGGASRPFAPRPPQTLDVEQERVRRMVREVFRHLDRNADGFVDEVEFRELANVRQSPLAPPIPPRLDEAGFARFLRIWVIPRLVIAYFLGRAHDFPVCRTLFDERGQSDLGALLDRDGTGAVSRAGVVRGFPLVVGRGFPVAVLPSILLDFVPHVRPRDMVVTKEQSPLLVAALDSDGDGVVTVEEFVSGVVQRFSPRGRYPRFLQADRRGIQRLDRADMVAAGIDPSFDVDGDGTVSVLDLLALEQDESRRLVMEHEHSSSGWSLPWRLFLLSAVMFSAGAFVHRKRDTATAPGDGEQPIVVPPGDGAESKPTIELACMLERLYGQRLHSLKNCLAVAGRNRANPAKARRRFFDSPSWERFQNVAAGWTDDVAAIVAASTRVLGVGNDRDLEGSRASLKIAVEALEGLRNSVDDPVAVGRRIQELDDERMVEELCRLHEHFVQVGQIITRELQALEIDVKELLQRSAAAVGGVGVTVEFEAEGRIRVEDRSDAVARLETVFENLLHNAEDAGARSVAITGSLSADGTELLLAFTNDGPPIPAELRSRLFERGVTSRQEGTGVGLAVCRENLSSLGGGISLDSSAPVRFVVTLDRGHGGSKGLHAGGGEDSGVASEGETRGR